VNSHLTFTILDQVAAFGCKNISLDILRANMSSISASIGCTRWTFSVPSRRLETATFKDLSKVIAPKGFAVIDYTKKLTLRFYSTQCLVDCNVGAIAAHGPECSTGISDFTSTNRDSVNSSDCLIASRVRWTKTFDSPQLTRSISFGETSTSFPGHQFRVFIIR
jgi:hypothetical protein